MAELTIRLARMEDAAAVARLNRAFNGVKATPDEIAARMQASAHVERVVLAESNGRVCGLACLRLALTPLYAAPYAELTELFVEEAYRRRGIGRALLGFVEELAREGGADHLLLQTGQLNKEAQAFYRAMDYAAYAVVLRKHLQG